MNLRRLISNIVRQVTGNDAEPSPDQRCDDSNDGIGVPVGVGPRPLSGGAQAKFPHVSEVDDAVAGQGKRI